MDLEVNPPRRCGGAAAIRPSRVIISPMKKDSFIRRIYTGDNLPILRGMDSGTVDLIYLDPPFNSGKQWENPVEAGGRKALASFKDTWELSDSHPDEEYSLGQQYPATLPLIDSLYAINGGSWKAYLIYMGVRMAEMRRILKPTGSIYYHCDPVMSHGVKLLMDAIFGGQATGKMGGNFRNEIIWCYAGGGTPRKDYPRKHDIILRYAKGRSPRFHVEYRPYGEHNTTGMRATDLGGRRDIHYRAEGTPINDWWTDIKPVINWNKENTGYPTQKPLALLERIIKTSSNKGELVLDPFCGCATTCHAAETLGRQWIGIDFAEEAARLVVDRLQKESDKQLKPSTKPSFADIEHLVIKGRQNLPTRGDLEKRADVSEFKPKLYKRQGGKCAGPCGEGGEGRAFPIDALEIDHIIARARGGQDEDANLQLLCPNCNTTKGDKGMDYLRRRILERRTRESIQEWREKWRREKE